MSIQKWTKPELIVMVRSMPEEAVLVACKFAEFLQKNGPNQYYYGRCDWSTKNCAGTCNVLGIS
jgi:hypothetical protein